MKLEPDSEWEAETFSDQDFTEAQLAGCVFEDCVFERCTLTGADFGGATLESCRFEGCEMSNCSVRGGKFREVQFEGCRMRGIVWSQVEPFGLELSFDKCNASYASFYGLHLVGFAATGCKLHEVDFGECTLDRADFSDSDMAGALFHGAKLKKVDFGTTHNLALDLRTAKFKDTKLSLDAAMHTLAAFGLELVLA